MHEIAHVLLNHQPVGFDPVTGIPKRKQNNEDEATYLGGMPSNSQKWFIMSDTTKDAVISDCTTF